MSRGQQSDIPFPTRALAMDGGKVGQKGAETPGGGQKPNDWLPVHINPSIPASVGFWGYPPVPSGEASYLNSSG